MIFRPTRLIKERTSHVIATRDALGNIPIGGAIRCHRTNDDGVFVVDSCLFEEKERDIPSQMRDVIGILTTLQGSEIDGLSVDLKTNHHLSCEDILFAVQIEMKTTTMKIAAAASTLFVLQVVADAAFVPCPAERGRQGHCIPLISIIDHDVSPQNNAAMFRQSTKLAASIKKKKDPFLNTPMRTVRETNGKQVDVDSESDEFISSRFERFDKKKYGKQLQDTRLDDFINRYSKTKTEAAASAGGSTNGFEESKFQRYDKNKDGSLLLDRDGGKRVDPEPTVDKTEDLVLERWRPERGVNRTDDMVLEKVNEGPLDHGRGKRSDARRYQNSTIPSSRTGSGQKFKSPVGATRAKVRDREATTRDTRKDLGDGGYQKYERRTEEGEQDKKKYRQPETQNLGIPTRSVSNPDSLLYDSWSNDRNKRANKGAKPTSETAGAPRSRSEGKKTLPGKFSVPSRQQVKTPFAIPKKPRVGPERVGERRPPPSSKSSVYNPASSQFNPPASSEPRVSRVYQSRPPERNFYQQPSPLEGENFAPPPPQGQQSQSHQPTGLSKVSTTVAFPSTRGKTAPQTPMTEASLTETAAANGLKGGESAGTDLMQDLFESTLKDTTTPPTDTPVPRSQQRSWKATPENEMQDVFESNMMEMMGMAPTTERKRKAVPHPRRSGGWDGWDDIPPVPTRSQNQADDVSTGPKRDRDISSVANADDEDKITTLLREIDELKAMVIMTSKSKETKIDALAVPKYTIKDYSQENSNLDLQAQTTEQAALANDKEYINDLDGYENLMLEQLLHQEEVESRREMNSSYLSDDGYIDRGDNAEEQEVAQDGFEENELEYIREAVVYENLSPNQSYGPVEMESRQGILSNEGISDGRQESTVREYIHEVQGPKQRPSPFKQRPSPKKRECVSSESSQETDKDDTLEGDEDSKPRPRSPGFVGFSGIDWSKGR